MEPQKITHIEIKEAVDTYYFVFKTKDALSKAADFVGASISTVKKWYYGQEEAPRWHYRQLRKLILKAEIKKKN